IRTELRNRLRGSHLSGKYTLQNVLNEIAIIKGKSSKKGKNKYMSATKKQNDYLQALGIPIIKDPYEHV
ncbi:MAG: hypothetical protein LBE09_01270, partial [Christensenellaceae bacterium]|nr:hypothetical protein [Christensenellaceae bacterium]